MTVVTAGMEKKPNAGGNLRPPCFVGDNQQCVTATEGADVSIAVDLASTGGLPTAILWRRGEEELVGDRYRVSENNNTVLLNLHNVTRDDAGHYTLTAKNSAGEARRAIEIKVDGAGDVPVFLRRLTDLAVKVGTRTRFLVEIRSSSEVTVSWHRNNEQLVEGERFHFVHEGSFFCVDVAPVVMEDGGRWTCVAVGAGGRASCSSHLNVLVPKAYKAPEFLEELQALLTEQGTVSLECKVVGVPTPVLRWYKDGQEIKAGDVFALTANPDDPTSLGTYTCEAVNCMGKAYSSSRVHVVGKGSREGSLKPADSMKPVGPAPVFKENLRDEKIKIGERVTLACQVSVPPWPHNITWYNKEGRVEDSDRYHIMADGLGGYMIDISGAEAADEGEWKCVATSSLGARGISTCHVSITYPKNYRKPRFLESLKAVLTDEGLVSFECKVVGFPTPQLRWFKDGQELKPGDVYQLTGTNSLGSYCCIARNCMGQATSTAELTVEDIQNQLNEEERLQLFSANQPPKFIVGLKSCEAKITEDFRFTVQVSVSPEPSISWYRDDEQLEETERYRVFREVLGSCHLDISSLEIIDQAEWKCVATNEFGHSVTSCFLKLIIPRHFKKPRFLESLRAILSEEGAVNLECKVIGVPQPVLKWYKDGEELKPGDIHRIISGQDGTCCLGTYTCEARNCMGTVASSASLLGFEERLMKAATQHKLEQGTSHMLARNPSLSTIHEERTSQMYDTPATERSATVDERAEVSFSFDGKEVSVSLYETPDLTEEEALQVVEMYADQLSEHVSEHNVVELPPLRFVKETSNTSKLLMEAIVIDVTHDAFASAAEDDLRTDADLEEFSITDDNGQQAPPLPKDVEQDGSDLFDKLDTEFLERALAPTVPYGIGEDAVAPKRPPRRKTNSSQRAKPDGDTKSSDTSAKGGVSPKEDEDRSDHFTDAVAYVSEKDSYVSARGSSGDGKAYNVADVEERLTGEPQSTKSSPPELVRNTELCTNGKDEEWQAAELEQDVAHRETGQIELKKKMRSIESGLGRSFEESTEERFGGELPGPKPERPARKRSKSRNERSIESGHGGSFEESGDDRTSSETSIGAPKVERRQSHKKVPSADVGTIESYMKKIQEQQNVLRQEGPGLQVATAEDIKMSTGKESRVCTEAQTEGSIMKKELESQQPLSMEFRDSGEEETEGKQGYLSSSNVDLPSLKSAEHVKSAAEKGEISLIESLTRSLQDIQEGLASVEKQVQDQSTSEPGYAMAGASLSEAPNKPIEHSLALGERKTALGAPYEKNVSGEVLETTPQETQEFHKSSALVEQQLDVEVREESIPEKTSVPVLDIVAHPVKQLQQDTAGVLQFADGTFKDTSDSRQDELPKQYIQCSLQTISQSIHELQAGIAILLQHIAYEHVGDTTSRIDSASILETLSHPLHELRRGLAEVQQETLLGGEIASVGQALMETFAPSIQELQEGLEALEQLTSMETWTTPITDPPSKKALHLLASPVDALQTGLSQVGEAFLIEIKPTKTLPGNICVLERLQITLQSLQHAIEIVPGISTLQEISGRVIVHDIDELKAVTLLVQPLMEILLCLNILEISEFKSMGQPILTTAERDQRLDIFIALLSGLHSQLTQIEERITAGATKNLTSQSAHVVTVQSLVMPIRNLKLNIDAMRGTVSLESSVSKFKLLEGLDKHLKEFTESLVKIEQEAVLKVTPKQTANLNSLSTAKAVMLYLENLREAIVKVNEQHTLEDHEEAAIKAISRLEGLAQPLLQMKQGLVGAVQSVLLEEDNKFVPESSPSNALESVVSPLEMWHKELSAVERELATGKETEPETNKYVETLLCQIKELQDGVIDVARQVTEAALGTSGLSALESLLQPLQGLQLAITVVAPKEACLMILEGMTESIEALLRGVGATEKQVLAEAIKDPRKLSVTKLGAITEPLKELQKEINLMEQKIQFESKEELASEASSLYALSGLLQPLRELQRCLLVMEHFALKQDVKPLVYKAAGLLVEPILELQRGISAINQKAAWQANAAESKGFTILEMLAQPLQGLQRALSVVEEQNIMILEEALIFEKVSSLAAVEKVTQSTQELHSRISTIEALFSCETTTKRSELMGTADLHKLAKPLAEIHKQLVQVENHIFEAGDRPISDRTFILCLEAIAKPMQELTTELSKVEQALIREPGLKFDQDEVGHCILQTLARPIKALQDSVAVMQCLAAQAKETAAVFQALTQPFQDLQDGLAMVLKHTTIETSVERCTQKASVSALQTLATSIEEIHSGIVVMKEQAVSESSEQAVSEKDAASFLESAAQNLKELQKDLGQVQHQILLEKAAEHPGDILLLTFATPVWELQRGLTLIEQNALLESSEKPMTAVSMVQAIAQPVQEIHEALAQIQEQVGLEAPDTTLLDRSEISILKTLANPIHELQKTLALIEHQVVLEPNEEQLSDKLGTSVLETIANPLEELHKNLVLVEQQVFLEEGEKSISEEARTSILETLAHPIQDLERCIAFMQHQVALEARVVEMSDRSSVSILKTLAQPLYELQRGLLQIEEQFVMEAKEEPLSAKTDLSLIKTLAQPIEQIQKSIAVIEKQVIFEAHVQPSSNVTSISALKELARPLYELQQNLVQIEQQIALEAKDEFLPELSLSVLKTVAQPIHEIQRTIALIQQQDLLEAGGEEMSDRTSMSLLQTLAQPLEELEKGIAEIQQQIELETTGETFSETSAFSVLQALAESIQEIHRDLAVIHECAVYEGGAETMSEKTGVSALQTLAKPIQELLEKIGAFQQQVPVEHCEVLSENEDVSVLMKLAQPVEELQRALLQVEQQVTLEAEAGDIQMESLGLLTKLAQPILEIQRNIALIENQAVLESAECLVTEKENLSLLRELATPLQELQKGILMIEQQELLDGPLSDATNVCDLTTFVSEDDASQAAGVIYVKEQRALESEADVFGAIHVEEQQTLESEADDLAVIHVDEQRGLGSEADVFGAIYVQEQQALESEADVLGAIHVEEQRALGSEAEVFGAISVEEQQALESKADVLGAIHLVDQRALGNEPGVFGVIHVEEQQVLESEGDILGAIHVEEQRALGSQTDVFGVIHVEEQRALESEADVFGVIHVEEQQALESEADVLGAIHLVDQRALGSEPDIFGVIHVEEQQILESEGNVLGAIHVEEQRALGSQTDVFGVIHLEEQRALESEADVFGVIHVEGQRTLESQSDVLGVIQVEEQRALASQSGALRAIHVGEERTLESEADVLGVIHVEEQRALESNPDILGVIHVEERRALEKETDVLGVIHVEEQRAVESEGNVLGVIHVEEPRALESNPDVLGVFHMEDQRSLESEADVLGVIHVEERPALERESGAVGVVHVEEQRALESKADVLGVMNVVKQRTLESESDAVSVILAEERRELETEPDILGIIHVEEERALESESGAVGVIHVEGQRAFESKADVLGVIRVQEQRALESESGAVGVIHVEKQRALESVSGAAGVILVEEQRALESNADVLGVIHMEDQRALEGEADVLGVIHVEEERALDSESRVLGVIYVEEQRALESESGALRVIHVEEQRALESEADVLGMIHEEQQQALESESRGLGVIQAEEQRVLEIESSTVGVIRVEEQPTLESEADVLGVIQVEEGRALESESRALGVIQVEEQRAVESESGAVGVIHVEEQRTLESESNILGVIHEGEQRTFESDSRPIGVIQVEEQRALESEYGSVGVIHVEEQRALESEYYGVGVIHVEEQRALESKADVLRAIRVEEQRALESESDAVGVIHVEEQRALECKGDVLRAISVEEQRALESDSDAFGAFRLEEERALESKLEVLRAIHVEEQRVLESESGVVGATDVKEQRALESEPDILGVIHVEEQRALESETGIVEVIHVEEQRALESDADVLRAIRVEEQRALESEADILGVFHVEEQRALEGKADALRAIHVEEQRALESESGAVGVIHAEEQRALESKADVLRAIHVEEQRALESEADAVGVIHVEEQRALESKADILDVIHVEEQRALESESGTFSGRTGARKLESTTVSQQEPELNEAVVQGQAPLEGNISQRTTENYEPHMAVLSHEMGRGTAIVKVPEVVEEELLSESAENVSKEAGIEPNIMEWNEKHRRETEVTQTEEKGITSIKVSGAEGSNEQNVKYETSNKEYGERESSKPEVEDESNRKNQAEFELGQEKSAVRKSEKEQGLDEKNVIGELEIRVEEKKETGRKKDDLVENENLNKELENIALKEKGQKLSERIKEQDEAEGNDKAEAEYTKRYSEPFESREKEPELAESNNEQEEARRKKNEMITAENKNVTEESSDKEQRERTEGKLGEVDKQERREKELKDAGLNKRDPETRQSQKKKKRDRELMKKEQEECERQKKEEEEAESKNKEQKEAEHSITEQEEEKHKKEELEESDRIKKVQEEPELEKTEDGAKGSTRKEEKAELKGKELTENEIEQTCDGGKTKKEGHRIRAVGKRKTDGKMKGQEKGTQDKELEEDLKDSDESRQIKEQVEPAKNEDETEDVESLHSSGVVQTKALDSAEERRLKGEGITLSVVGGTRDDAVSREREDTVRHRKRSQQDTEDVEQKTARSRTEAMQNDNKVEWVAEGMVQKMRSFDDRPWAEENAVGRHRQYDDSLDSSDTITHSSTSSTLTPTSQQQTLTRTEGTRRIVVKDKVESGPRDARKKPTFATRLTDRTAAQGSRIKLTCSVLGSPEPVVEWLRDGLPVFGESRYRTRCEDGLASLEVLNASPGDSAEFTCVARNLHGEASSSATLKVFAGFEPAPSPPTFTRAIKDSYRFSDDELILECRVRCHPPPKVTWLKDGVPLQGSHRHQQSELADGVCRLIISSPDRTADSGQYTCVAENNVWSDQISSAVQFAGRDSYATSRRSRATSRISRDVRRPHISNVLTDHAVPLGGTAALQVEVKGAPKLDVTWLKGNEPLHFLTPNVRTFEESGVYNLVLTDVTEKEAGLYTCRASNAYGHMDTSATVGIVVPGSVRGGKPAMFINRPDMDMAVALGEDICVSFRVTGDPKPKVTWMKGVRDITNSQRSLKETIDDYVRLTLKRAVVSDAGTYCILAKNVYGCDRAFFTVTMRQRARSLTPSLEWNCQTASEILRDVRDSIEIARMKDVPGPVAGEPTVVDSGRNWLTLSWPKSEVRGGAPVLAYRVEAWPLGGEGGARWIEMGVCPTNTFDAFNLKAGTQYKFRVTPRNRYGWGESVTTTAAIVVGCKVELPEFTRILPGQLKALRGSSINLECEVRGDPVPRVQWYRDGMELNDPRFVAHLDGSQHCTLTMQDLRDGDSGRYMCEATNRVGRVSTFARLFVVNDPKILEADHKLKRGIQEDQQAGGTDMPPQFTMRLRDRRVQMTYPVRLTCQVAGCPAPEVTWSKDGHVIKEDDHHVFWTEGNFHTLEMSHTTLEDSGCYSATARNSNGAVSCPCHLVVDKGIRAYVAPEFLFELDPEHSVREGGELRLSAQVEAYPTVGVMWHRDGVRLRPSRRTVMTLNHDGTVELALAGVSRRDAGVYSCTATNEVGRAETSTRVTVQVTEAPPTADLPTVIGPEIPYSKVPLFVTKPRSTEAVEGDTVIIHCEVVGDPKPEVMWLRDWLKPDYYRDAPHFRRVGDGPQYRLEIPRAKLDFTGAYSVIARNCHGEAKAVISLQIYAKGQGKEDRMDRSSVTHGKVQTLPVVKRELKDLRCCDGDAVTLECCVQATPAPDIRWEKGGRLLPLGGDFSAEFDGATARLHIHQVYPEDEGEYTCVAYNELGRAITSACLVVDVPEEKETLLSRQLSRPPGLLSAGSTPRSTPRTTPSRSKSPSEPRHRDRDGTPARYICADSRPHRLKAAAPKFYAVPHNRVAEEGETVRFQCAIAGHPTPWVSWDKDGVLVTPSARLTLSERDDLRILEISEVTVEDAGFYRITLENEVGRVEASARLEVIGHYGGRSRVVRAWSASPRTSPTFGRRLVGSAARVGGRLTLACDLRGSPTPASTWYRNGELVVRSSRVIPTWDGRTARLEIENLELEDAGLYTCVAENEVGRTRCSARLVVLEKDDPSQEDRRPPVFLQDLPAEVVATDGDVLDLKVRLEGTPPLDVVWVKDGVEIPDCEDFRYVDRGDGRFELRLADVFPLDSGTYSCEVYNEHGEAVTSTRLSVREGSTSVQFSKRPTPVLTSPGSTATFCARVHSCGGARPRVSWTVAGRLLDCSRHKVQYDGDVHMLHIAPVELCDSGQVTCVARTGMSGDGECVARTELTVRDDDDMYDEEGSCSLQAEDVAPAMLIRGPSDTTALRGDRVVLKATYVGVPQPVVRWLKAGHELSSGGRVAITTGDGVTCLVIENMTADDSGKYVVSVENSLGADCSFSSVAVEGPADPPAGRPSVSCSGNTVTVTWCSAPYDGGCMVTGYCVEMKRTEDTEWQVVTDRCHSLSYMIPGLTPAERCVFRVRAENAHGLSEASAESEPFQMGSDEESFRPVFEPRVVTLAPGEEFKANYEVLEELGKGRYGVVHKVVEHATGQKYAAKFIRCIKAKDREKVQEEIGIMNILRHPKLLQLAAAFESPKEVVMVMEYISGGELFERVVADDFTLTERDCILFTRQICEGVDYMHQNYVVHLDLKPENIMCHTRTSHQIKLIDFGLAQKINPDTPVRVLFGTPEFIPPEIINYEPIGVESDMWSVGVICYVLLSGLSPFMGDNDAETFANITRADYDFDDEAFDAISQDAKDFISALLVKRKEKRMTARECLQHTWLAQHDEKMSCIRLCTDKLKKFIIRRKWQKTGNAIRALGRMATLSAATRRNSNASSTSSSPRPSLSGCCGNVSRMSSLNEEDLETAASNNACSDTNSVINGFGEMTLTKCGRSRLCSERSDSGISDCSSIAAPSAHSHCQCATTLLLSKKFSISEEKETCSEKLSETMVHGACKSGKISSVACENIQSRATGMTSVFSTGNNSNNIVPSHSAAVSNVSPCSSSSAKCSAKKTDSLKQQSSVDSGVHVDVGTCPSPDIPTGNVRARKNKLASSQEQQKQKDVCDEALRHVSGIVQARSAVLSAAQEEETKPKSTPRKKTNNHPSPISTSHEHSANYQKVMAFWKR